MNSSQPFTIQFLNKKEVGKDTFSFSFKRPAGFDFVAGQYNRWTLPITASDGRGASRFFTISSSPLEKEYISLTTKIIQSDFKKALMNLKEHDEIKIFGPMGDFVLDETDPRERILIAGGIGITPFHSMLLYAAVKNLRIPLNLFVSFSIPEEMVFFDELTELAKAHQNMKIVYTITKPQESKISWTGETGRISETLLKKHAKDVTQSIFYLVGPPSMVEGTKKLLEDMNITNENIKMEQFSGY